MAVDLTGKKQVFIGEAVALVGETLELYKRLSFLRIENDEFYKGGKRIALTDSDFQENPAGLPNPPHAHLDAAKFQAAMTALADIQQGLEQGNNADLKALQEARR